VENGLTIRIGARTTPGRREIAAVQTTELSHRTNPRISPLTCENSPPQGGFHRMRTVEMRVVTLLPNRERMTARGPGLPNLRRAVSSTSVYALRSELNCKCWGHALTFEHQAPRI
jgi:hypothetical protein